MDFPFVAELPKREKSRVAKLWDAFAEIKALVEAHGVLMPFNLAADLGGVSPQRISQLVHRGEFETVEVRGHRYITEDSFVTWAKSERKNGRPLKIPATPGEAWKLAKKTSKKRL